MPLDSDSVFIQKLVKRARPRVYQLMMAPDNFVVLGARERTSKRYNREVTISLDLNYNPLLIPVPDAQRYEKRRVRYTAPELQQLIGNQPIAVTPAAQGLLTSEEVTAKLIDLGYGTEGTISTTLLSNLGDLYQVQAIASSSNPYASGKHVFDVNAAQADYYLQGAEYASTPSGFNLVYTDGSIVAESGGASIELAGYVLIKQPLTPPKRFNIQIDPALISSFFAVLLLEDNGQEETDAVLQFTGASVALNLNAGGTGTFQAMDQGALNPINISLSNALGIVSIEVTVINETVTFKTKDESGNVLDLFGVSTNVYNVSRLAIFSIGDALQNIPANGAIVTVENIEEY